MNKYKFNFKIEQQHYSGRQIEKKKKVTVIYFKECSKFSSKSFIAFYLTLRSLIHFELIFVYSVRMFSFHFLQVAIWFSQHHF